MKTALTHALLWLLRVLGRMPHAWLKALAAALAPLVYRAAGARRHIALTNLRLCFPQWTPEQHEQAAKAHVYAYLRSFLERFRMWGASKDQICAFVRIEGLEHLQAQRDRPVVLLAPHFVGLDMGGTRLQFERETFSMYAPQSNAVLDLAIRQGREQFGASILSRRDGMMKTVRYLRDGKAFYFLPDMDLGPKDAVFVPFFGVPAATVTSVARLAQLCKAAVVPVVPRMVDDGYVVTIYPAWEDFPGADVEAATLRMNQFIEQRVLEILPQYLWTHKRFKTRPEGVPSVYQR
jgi:Kdo2-lipid IVA lauroyltransferase/acyltransferase